MADNKKDAPKAAKDVPKKKKGGKLGMYTFFAVVFCASPFILPSILLILIGLLPSLLALFVDKDPDKSATAAVGAMNFAGLSPFLIDLWMKGQTVDNVFRILKDQTTWVFILAAAFAGWMIVFSIPSMMAQFTFNSYEARLKLLQRNLENLKTTWGPDVGTIKPLDQIVIKE